MKKNINFRIKQLIISGIIASSVCTFTGCGEVMKAFVETDLMASLTGRVDANSQMADKLAAAGFISTESANSLKKSMETVKDSVVKSIDAAISKDELDTTGPLLKAIVSFSPISPTEIANAGHATTDANGNTVASITDNDGKELQLGLTDDWSGLNEYAFINYLANEGHWKAPSGSGGFSSTQIYNVNSSEPIVLVDSKIANDINSRLNFNVYVLKSDMMTKDGTNSIDGIMTLLQNNIQQNTDGYTITNVGTLNNYFQQALDENGKPIKLIDQVTTTDANGNSVSELPLEYQVVQTSKADTSNGTALQSTKNQCGYDVILRQWDVPCAAIRLTEFNEEAFNNLNNLIGLNSGKYVFYSDGKGNNNVYVMEYPVSVLSSIAVDSTDSSKVVGTLENSGLGINLLTGDIIKYESDGQGGWLANGEVVSELADKYLTTDSASSNDATGISSFILKGMTTVDVGCTYIDGQTKTKKVPCGRIILRDYLEGSFAPGFVEGENVVVFGRKIRIDFNWDSGTEYYYNGKALSGVKQYIPVWSKDIEMAFFVDKEGNKVTTSPTFKITDFANISLLMGSRSYSVCKVQSIVPPGQAASSKPSTLEDGQVPTITNLASETIDNPSISLRITEPFPSKNIGEADWANDSNAKQRFYVIMTNKGLLDTNLMSGWINSTSTTESLAWWNTYLSDNNFSYNVSHEAVVDYLLNNYSFELSQSGIIILDLETIAKIQEMYDKEADNERTSSIRTFFMLLGWAMIVYSSVLMLAWALDTNTDIGIKLLQKLSFGHWVAVKYEEDIPSGNIDGTIYLTGGRMFIKCLILVAMGLVLIYINVFRIVLLLVETFGSVARMLEKIIKGLN